MAYLDLAGFEQRSLMPSDDVALLESLRPGFIESRIALRQSMLDSRLRKRYAVPFVATVPEIIMGWLTSLVTLDAYIARGVNPQDQTLALVRADYETAEKQIAEAADSKDGLFDLPVREDLQTSAVTQSSPLSYSEQSPYTWTRSQATSGRQEDSNG